MCNNTVGVACWHSPSAFHHHQDELNRRAQHTGQSPVLSDLEESGQSADGQDPELRLHLSKEQREVAEPVGYIIAA